MFFEEDRSAVHECGHALACLLFTGVAAQVNLKSPGGGCAIPMAYAFKGLLDQPLSDDLFVTCFTVAGGEAERLCYGQRDREICADDEQQARWSLKEVWACGLEAITLPDIEAVVYTMISRYQPALIAGAKMIAGSSTTDGRRLTDRFIATDATGELASYADTPLLAKDVWGRLRWWWHEAGVPWLSYRRES